MFEIDTLNLVGAKLENTFNFRMDSVERLSSKQRRSGSNSNVSVVYCSVCGDNHDSTNYFHVEQVHNVNNYNRPPQNISFSITYIQVGRIIPI